MHLPPLEANTKVEARKGIVMDAMVSMLLVLALAFVTQTVPKPEPPDTAPVVQRAPPVWSPPDTLGCSIGEGE